MSITPRVIASRGTGGGVSAGQVQTTVNDAIEAKAQPTIKRYADLTEANSDPTLTWPNPGPAVLVAELLDGTRVTAPPGAFTFAAGLAADPSADVALAVPVASLGTPAAPAKIGVLTDGRTVYADAAGDWTLEAPAGDEIDETVTAASIGQPAAKALGIDPVTGAHLYRDGAGNWAAFPSADGKLTRFATRNEAATPWPVIVTQWRDAGGSVNAAAELYDGSTADIGRDHFNGASWQFSLLQVDGSDRLMDQLAVTVDNLERTDPVLLTVYDSGPPVASWDLVDLFPAGSGPATVVLDLPVPINGGTISVYIRGDAQSGAARLRVLELEPRGGIRLARTVYEIPDGTYEDPAGAVTVIAPGETVRPVLVAEAAWRGLWQRVADNEYRLDPVEFADLVAGSGTTLPDPSSPLLLWTVFGGEPDLYVKVNGVWEPYGVSTAADPLVAQTNVAAATYDASTFVRTAELLNVVVNKDTADLVVSGLITADRTVEPGANLVLAWDGAGWSPAFHIQEDPVSPLYEPGTAYVAGDPVLSAVPVGTATTGAAGQLARWTRIADGNSPAADADNLSGAMELGEEVNWTYEGPAADTFVGLSDVDWGAAVEGDMPTWDAALNKLVPGRATFEFEIFPTFAAARAAAVLWEPGDRAWISDDGPNGNGAIREVMPDFAAVGVDPSQSTSRWSGPYGWRDAVASVMSDESVMSDQSVMAG